MTDDENAREDVDEDVVPHDLVQQSAEPYSLLCELLEGDALTILRSVGSPRGLRAWQLVYQKYNPRTMAKGTKMLCEVTSPCRLRLKLFTSWTPSGMPVS